MADDPDTGAKEVREIINVYDDGDRRYWANELGISETHLVELVIKYGAMIKDIRSRVDSG